MSWNSGFRLPVSSFFLRAILLAVCSKPVKVIYGLAILMLPFDPIYLLFFPSVRLCLGIIGFLPYISAKVYSLTCTFALTIGIYGTLIPFVFTMPALSALSYTCW